MSIYTSSRHRLAIANSLLFGAWQIVHSVFIRGLIRGQTARMNRNNKLHKMLKPLSLIEPTMRHDFNHLCSLIARRSWIRTPAIPAAVHIKFAHFACAHVGSNWCSRFFPHQRQVCYRSYSYLSNSSSELYPHKSLRCTKAI